MQILVHDGSVDDPALAPLDYLWCRRAGREYSDALVTLVRQPQPLRLAASDPHHHVQPESSWHRGQRASHGCEPSSGLALSSATSKKVSLEAAAIRAPSSTFRSRVIHTGLPVVLRLDDAPPPDVTLSPCSPRPTATTRAPWITIDAPGSRSVAACRALL